jgi:chromosome segregation ATPase
MEKESVMMTKKEFISQLTLCASRYADERLGDNNKLFASNQHLREDMLEWEQKYHSAMAANKRLDEQNEGLQVEKQALLDVLSEWKSEVQSLNALNATLSGELQELKKGEEALLRTIQNREGDHRSIKHELDQVRKELAEDNAEKLRLHCLLRNRTEELAAAEEKHEDFKTKSHGILATLEENLQKKQEIIEALTCWKEFAENLHWTRWKN